MIGSHISRMIKYVQFLNVPLIVTELLDGDISPTHNFLANEPEVLKGKKLLISYGKTQFKVIFSVL